jgi:hypothetical protein
MLSPRPRALAPLPSAPCCLSAMSPAPSWPSPHPDAELVARIRGGDAAAFELLFRTYHSDLRAFAVFASSSRKMPGKSGLRRGSGRGCDESEDVGQAIFEGPRMKAPSLLLAVTGSSSARWVARLECAPLAADRSRTSDLLLIAWFIVYPPGDAIAGSGSDPGAPRVRGVPHVDA